MAGRGKRKSKAPTQVTRLAKRVQSEEVESKAESNQQAESSVPEQVRQELERLYSLRMPPDFYHFWEFCRQLRPDNPQVALQDTVGVQLVGPFDVVCGKHTRVSSALNLHLHWRHYYDPPEFQTLLQGDMATHLHLGYYRDSPDALPVFVGQNETKKGCSITQMGENLFAAMLLLVGRKKRECSGQGNKALEKLEVKLRKEAERLGLPLEQKTKAMKQRDKKVSSSRRSLCCPVHSHYFTAKNNCVCENQVVSKTFHGAGIVVPVDKNDVGYREVPETDAGLKRICKAIVEAEDDDERMKVFAPLQNMITFVHFANDECDYGMGLELGIDLFCYGSHYFSKVIGQLLHMAYKLLQRDVFADIIMAHLANRSHDDLDQLAAV